MIQIYNNTEEINIAAADLFIAAAQKAIAEKDKFTVVLTGGSSPAGVYKLLASDDYKNKIDWSKVFIFWGDERWVPLNDDLSNAKMSYAALLSHVPIPAENIFEMYKDGVTPEDYAVTYEQSIRTVLGDEGKFDLILLGMGDDGHTASIFPDNMELLQSDQAVAVGVHPVSGQERITLTGKTILEAKQVVFLITGSSKATVLRQIIKHEPQGEHYPTFYVAKNAKSADFYLDRAAAALL